MEIENAYIDIEDVQYDEKVGQWLVAKIDLDTYKVADNMDMEILIDDRIHDAVQANADAMEHDREVAVDDAVTHFVQRLLDAAAGLRPADEGAARVLQQLRTL